MLKNILSSLGSKIMGKKQDSFWTKLVKEDTNVSVMNFFLMATLAVGVLLLFVPVVAMAVDVWFNHTLTINMSDLGMYIGAVAGIFAAGGLSSAWTEFAYSKYNVSPITEEDMARSEANAELIRDENHNGIPDEEEELDEEEKI
jgi:hypothetical protein